MKQSIFASWPKILMFYLKSNKVLTILLVFLPFLLSYSAAVSNIEVMSTPEEVMLYITQNQGNPLLGFIADDTIEAATIWRIRVSACVILAVFNVVLMSGMTRKDEELGRLELLRSGSIGYAAPLLSATIKLYGANLFGGIMMALGFIAAGFPASGSFIAGMSTALACCLIAGMTAIAAQIAPDASLARGFSYGALAVFFILQVISNVIENAALLLWTPFGWCAYARPYAQSHTGEVFLFFLFALIAVAASTKYAFCLMKRRDLGGSFIRERKARGTGKKSLSSPFALAWRLQRGMLFVWVAAFAAMGLVIASLMPGIDEMFGADTGFLSELSAITGGPGKAFLALLSYILTQVVAAYAILSVSRIREEERSSRAEIVLAAPVSRLSFAASHLLIAFLGSATCILVFGLCTGEPATAAARIPAVWITASIPLFVYGFAPRMAAPAGWSVFGLMLALELMWELRFISNAVFSLSPFAHVYPGVNVTAPAVIVLLLLSAVLAGLGLAGFVKRDMVWD